MPHLICRQRESSVPAPLIVTCPFALLHTRLLHLSTEVCSTDIDIPAAMTTARKSARCCAAVQCPHCRGWFRRCHQQRRYWPRCAPAVPSSLKFRIGIIACCHGYWRVWPFEVWPFEVWPFEIPRACMASCVQRYARTSLHFRRNVYCRTCS